MILYVVYTINFVPIACYYEKELAMEYLKYGHSIFAREIGEV